MIFLQIPARAATTSITLAWNSTTDPNVAGYNIYYGTVSGNYTEKITAGNATNVTLSGLVRGLTYYFAATTYSFSGVESAYSSELPYLIPATASTANQPPTLDPISDLTITEGAPQQTVSLSDITSGATTENQTLTVTASSSNTKVIPNPKVEYTKGHTTGKLTFKPAAKATGTATISVTVNDHGANNNLTTQTFTVTVTPVPPPSFDTIGDLTVAENAALQSLTVTGISSGATGEKPKLHLAAKSSNKRLVQNPKIKYRNPGNTATLTFVPIKNKTGTTIITLSLKDNARKINNLYSQTFMITVSNGVATSVTETSTNTVTANAGNIILHVLGYTQGRYSFSVAPSPGNGPVVTRAAYAVEASTDLINWVPLGTNRPPFSFTDPSAGQFSRRFYRVVPVP